MSGFSQNLFCHLLSDLRSCFLPRTSVSLSHALKARNASPGFEELNISILQHLMVKHEHPLLDKQMKCSQRENGTDIPSLSHLVRGYALSAFFLFFLVQPNSDVR